MRVVIHHHSADILVDPLDSFVHVEAAQKGDIILRNDGETHLRVKRTVKLKRFRRFFGPLNCVEIVKGCLGISKPFLFTPYQLYKALKNE